ncbi:MAG: Zn-dependent alcohol dehydrogenase [Deltaproteobacteria bacterium]
MKAAILNAREQALEIRDDVELLELGANDVHVKLVASGVCHSDLSAQNGTLPSPLPCVLGHEGAGIVQEVGTAVQGVKAGDSVIASFTPACGVCRRCLGGQPFLCELMHSTASANRFRVGGEELVAFCGLGTFAEEMIVSAAAVVPVPSDIPLDIAALIGCGVTTGVGAAMWTAEVTPGSSVVVIGAGGVGIAAIQGARIAGAAEILAVDTVESKLDQAKHFGATHAVLPDDIESAVNEITAGDGFDFALECIGHPKTVRQAYDMTRRGGTTVIVGMGRFAESVSFNGFELAYQAKTIKGSMFGSADVRTDFGKLLRLWRQGKLDLEGMISRRIGLADVNDAFRAMEEGEVIRSVIDY